jgi:hypothetical protein
VRWFEWLKHRRRAERDVDRGIQGHLELEAEDQLAVGLAEEEARRAANRALGNVMYAKESTREMWGSGWFERLRQDLKPPLR